MSKNLQPWAFASRGMVICEDGQAAAAGAGVLAAGGSALDAAVTAAITACGPRAQSHMAALVRLPGRPLATLAAPARDVRSLLSDVQSDWEAPVATPYGGFTLMSAAVPGAAADEADTRRFIACDADGGIAALAFGPSAPVMLLQQETPVWLLSSAHAGDSHAVLSILADRRLSLQDALRSDGLTGSTYAVELSGPGFSGGCCGRHPAALIGLSGGPAHILPGVNFFVTPI